MKKMIEYDEDQRTELEIGKLNSVDTSFYDNPEFLAIQMRQIRLGLEDGLDVTIYNNPEYDWFQMEEIRKGMKTRVNYKLYAKPDIDYKRMRQIRKGLECGIDLTMFMKLDAGVLEELRKALVSKISIVEYIREGYQVEQLAAIRTALERDCDIHPYISVEHRGAAIREIALGLEAGLHVSLYASVEYNWQQMREIRLGMEERLDVAIYANELYNWQQMREIRLGLLEGIDVNQYRSYIYAPSDMERIRRKLLAERKEYAISENGGKTETGKWAISISSDEMEARIEVHSDIEGDVSAAEIKESLMARGVCRGILDTEIESIVNEKKYGTLITVAKGKQPIKGEDGRYKYYFNTAPTKEPYVSSEGIADFRTMDWFELVTQGQQIASYVAAKEGENGYTITGKTLKARKGKEKKLLTGAGFSLQDDGITYIADFDGKIEVIDESRIEIHKVHILDEVNSMTGKVEYQGSVFIKGNVESGASIHATGDVVVNGFVEAAVIRCGGDVCLRKGSNGGGTGLIEARGTVAGQFFESIHIIAGKDIMAHYAMNCEVRVGGKVHFYGSKGRLIGGYLKAAKGVNIPNIGNQSGTNTFLNVGASHELLKAVSLLNAKVEDVKKEKSILENLCETFQKKYPAEVRNTLEVYLKVENSIYAKKMELEKLEGDLEKLESERQQMKEAQIVVEGTLYEGTEIIMDNTKWNPSTVSNTVVRCVNKHIYVETR